MTSMVVMEARPPYVRFEVRAVEDRAASIAAGAWRAKDVIFAIITPSGSKDEVDLVADEWIESMKREAQQERVPDNWPVYYDRQFKAFKENQELPLEGTAIANWPPISPAMRKLLDSINVRTVEDLAGANEATLQLIGMGARSWKMRAEEFLRAQATTTHSEEMAALRKENADMREQLKELTTTLQQFMAAPVKEPAA